MTLLIAMPPDMIVTLSRSVLKEVAMVAAPVLGTAVAVSLVINIVQVLTSLQETTISTVPRLLACASAIFVMLPWMVRQLGSFTTQMLSDFHQYLQ